MNMFSPWFDGWYFDRHTNILDRGTTPKEYGMFLATKRKCKRRKKK